MTLSPSGRKRSPELLSFQVGKDPDVSTTQRLPASKYLIVIAAASLAVEFQSAAELQKDY
jgi:hypothetical protein